MFDVRDRIFADLEGKGLLYCTEEHQHRYPFCWRCNSELVFRVVDEWFISMDELRHTMMEITRNVQWIPAFGLERELDWLRNMHDWMISKKRYWGLALPIWACDACGGFEVIGSEHELEERAVEGWPEFAGHSPHRPWIDGVKIACSSCGDEDLPHPRRRQPVAGRRHRAVLDHRLSQRPRPLARLVPRPTGSRSRFPVSSATGSTRFWR